MDLIINRKNLVVARAAYKPDDRPNLHAVHLSPDGTTIATDGLRLAMVTPEEDIQTAAFPEAVEIPEPVLIPLELAKNIERHLKKQKAAKTDGETGDLFPELTATHRRVAQTSDDPMRLEFLARDAELSEALFSGDSVQDDPPNYDAVMPKDVGKKTHAMVRLDARLLKDLAAIALDFGCDYVDLAVHHQKKVDPTSPAIPGYTEEMVVAVCDHEISGQKLTQLLMPIRNDREAD